MKKVVIVGGGIAGLTAGILLQKAGYQTEIYEKNPLPAEEGATSCDSAVGSMMNPLSKKEIDNIVAEFSGVVTMNKFELTGKDCTATLVFDTATGKVESLTQIMNYFIEVDAKAVIVPVSGYATLTNKMTINNVTYK